MMHIRVVAAIIIDFKQKRILATQRGRGDYKGKWEFPGGKIEQDETVEQALFREIKEELNLDIRILEFFQKVNYTYPEFRLEMDCYFVEIQSGELILTEHLAYRWLNITQLKKVDWLPADIDLIDNLKNTPNLFSSL